jgi:hypothetical protein
LIEQFFKQPRFHPVIETPRHLRKLEREMVPIIEHAAPVGRGGPAVVQVTAVAEQIDLLRMIPVMR